MRLLGLPLRLCPSSLLSHPPTSNTSVLEGQHPLSHLLDSSFSFPGIPYQRRVLRAGWAEHIVMAPAGSLHPARGRGTGRVPWDLGTTPLSVPEPRAVNFHATPSEQCHGGGMTLMFQFPARYWLLF